MKLPHEIEHYILEVLGMPHLNKKNMSRYLKRLNNIRQQMYKLSNDFAGLKSTEENYADAYFAYNFPMNFMKVVAITRELTALYPDLLRHKKTLNIVDVGCGDGAGMLGVYYGLKNSTTFSMVGIDASGSLLKRCKEITDWFTRRDTRAVVQLIKQNIAPRLFKETHQKYDIVLFVNSLAEISTDENIPHIFIEQVLRCTQPDGIVIIIEPALKKFTRRLMALRDEVVITQKALTLLPCLDVTACPLLAIKKEWCHQSISWKPPEFMNMLNRGLNRDILYLKYSYFVISKKNYTRRYANDFRVISHVLKEKGKKRCFLCTQNGRVELVLLNKLKSASNYAFDEITKGDIIMLDNVVHKRPSYWHIQKDTEVTILLHL
jgi:ribosomal protein RSM22 (predicted rRNA methylase)